MLFYSSYFSYKKKVFGAFLKSAWKENAAE